jgi:hypothetical protein
MTEIAPRAALAAAFAFQAERARAYGPGYFESDEFAEEFSQLAESIGVPDRSRPTISIEAALDLGHARSTWDNGGGLALAHRFAHVGDIFEGFGGDGIDGDRLSAGVQWALTGEPGTGAADDLINLFAAPYVAAADEGEFKGDAQHEARLDIDRVGAEAIA